MSYSTVPPHGYRRFICQNCGNSIDVPIHCSSKSCEFCTTRRRYRIRERIWYALQGLPPNSTLRWRHIVLTVKNGHDLQERLDHLIKSFRKLRQRKLWKSTQHGGFYVIEITEGVTGWHPHLHVVSFGYYIPWRKLSSAWLQISKDSFHVAVRTIKEAENIAYYVSKYVTKVQTLASNSIATVDSVCRNRRLFGPFGKMSELMKNFKPPPKFAVCSRCHQTAWVPEFIIEMMSRLTSRYT